MRLSERIYPMMEQARKRIIETMQKRGLTKVDLIMNREQFAKENGFDDVDDAEDEYITYRDNEAPYVIYFDKWGSGCDYAALSAELVDGISLEDGTERKRFKLECYSGELGSDTFYDHDLTYMSMMQVYDCMLEELELDEEPEKIWLVKQESNVDGLIIFNVTPCKDKEAAAKVVADEVHILLTESTPYQGALDYIEGRKEVDDDCPFSWDGNIDGYEGFYISTVCDDYYEQITVEEKEII